MNSAFFVIFFYPLVFVVALGFYLLSRALFLRNRSFAAVLGGIVAVGAGLLLLVSIVFTMVEIVAFLPSVVLASLNTHFLLRTTVGKREEKPFVAAFWTMMGLQAVWPLVCLLFQLGLPQKNAEAAADVNTVTLLVTLPFPPLAAALHWGWFRRMKKLQRG